MFVELRRYGQVVLLIGLVVMPTTESRRQTKNTRGNIRDVHHTDSVNDSQQQSSGTTTQHKILVGHKYLTDEEKLCSNLSLKESGLYQEHLLVLKKYIPHYRKMHSNCWSSTNMKALPHDLGLKVRSIRSFRDLRNQFSVQELRTILSSVINNRSSTISNQSTKRTYCLPSVYLIGFSKSGTSTLYSYISSHPLFAKPRNKEGQFWKEFVGATDLKYQELSVYLYLHHFIDASSEIIKNPKQFTMDASASTVYATLPHGDSAEKDVCAIPLLLHSILPRTKILVILRNPVERLWSDYWFFCSRIKWKVGNSYIIPDYIPPIASELFHNISIAAIKKFHSCVGEGKTTFYCTVIENSFPPQDVACADVRLGVSMYYYHLVKWFNIFPRNQIQVIRLEDLSSSFDYTMKVVWDFVGINGVDHMTEHKVMNQNRWIGKLQYKNDFVFWPKTKTLLAKFFSPYNIKLSKLLNDRRFLWNG